MVVEGVLQTAENGNGPGAFLIGFGLPISIIAPIPHMKKIWARPFTMDKYVRLEVWSGRVAEGQGFGG